MSQSLKDFMNEHRRDFDSEMPGMHNWTAIEKRIAIKKNSSVRQWAGWAVAAILLIAISFGGFQYLNKKTEPVNKEVAGTGFADFEDWPAEFAAKAKSYYETIEERQRRLEQMARKAPGLASQFEGDMAALDSAYQILHRQAMQTPGSEVIIRAMIQNLQLQAELLSRQLSIINQYSNNQKNSHENEKNSSRSL